jgi:tetratricopeptide (TPR) repeat protein
VCRQLVTSALLCQRPAQAVQTLLNAAQLLQFGRAALLTPVHTDLLQTCLKAKVYHVAERVADAQLYELAPLDNGLTAQDYLAFHYYAAIAYVAAKKFERALECLQLVLTAPSSALSQVQIAAYGKYVLCCFIVHGRAVDLPSRITSSVVLRLLPKLCEVYEQLAVQQRKGVEPLRAALDEHKAALAQDGNFGLAKQAVAALVRRNIQRLTNTYTTLALRDIAEQNKLPGGAAEAERLVLQMIEEGALAATVDQRDGSVTFHTDVERYSSSRMAERLHLQVRELQQLSRKLKQEEEEIVTSRDYLAKTLRAGTMSAARGGGGGGGGGGQGGFDEPL